MFIIAHVIIIARHCARVIRYLRLHLIDEEIVSMKNFERYTPFDGQAAEGAPSKCGAQRHMIRVIPPYSYRDYASFLVLGYL